MSKCWLFKCISGINKNSNLKFQSEHDTHHAEHISQTALALKFLSLNMWAFIYSIHLFQSTVCSYIFQEFIIYNNYFKLWYPLWHSLHVFIGSISSEKEAPMCSLSSALSHHWSQSDQVWLMTYQLCGLIERYRKIHDSNLPPCSLPQCKILHHCQLYGIKTKMPLSGTFSPNDIPRQIAQDIFTDCLECKNPSFSELYEKQSVMYDVINVSS